MGGMQGGNGRGCSIGLGHDLGNGGDLPERALAEGTDREEPFSRAAASVPDLTIARNDKPQYDSGELVVFWWVGFEGSAKPPTCPRHNRALDCLGYGSPGHPRPGLPFMWNPTISIWVFPFRGPASPDAP
jgi:hypothetical protein